MFSALTKANVEVLPIISWLEEIARWSKAASKIDQSYSFSNSMILIALAEFPITSSSKWYVLIDSALQLP